jgi:hypothetical protein
VKFLARVDDQCPKNAFPLKLCYPPSNSRIQRQAATWNFIATDLIDLI